MEKFDKLIGLLSSYSDRKVQYFLGCVSDDDIENMMYFHPEEFGSLFQHNMSARAYEMLESTVEGMNRPSESEVIFTIENLITIIESYEYRLNWDTLVEDNNRDVPFDDERYISLDEKYNIQ